MTFKLLPSSVPSIFDLLSELVPVLCSFRVGTVSLFNVLECFAIQADKGLLLLMMVRSH